VMEEGHILGFLNSGLLSRDLISFLCYRKEEKTFAQNLYVT